MAYIKLTQEKYALVDDEDVARLSEYNWYVKKPVNGNGWYAVTNMWDAIEGKQRTVYMHTFILEFPDCDYIDHVNLDTLDNRKINLREATRGESIAHRPLPLGVSKYRGVTRSGNRWIARIAVNDVREYLGTFDTPEEAAKAYNDAAKICHKEFAILNNVGERDD